MGRPALAAVKGLKPRAPTAPRALVTPAASEARPVSAETVSREVSVAPPAPAPAPAPAIPRAGAAECKTVREILPPWEVLQEKLNKKNASVAPARNEVLNQGAQQALAAQEAANSLWSPPAARTSSPSYAQPRDSIEAPPSSGVRMSDSGPAAADLSAVGMPDSLSFKVYTVADLERRSDAPISMRGSRVNFDMTSSRSSLHWQRAYVALKAFASASLAWLTTKGERPSVKVALRQPFDNLGDELQVAVESIDWRKLGVTTGIVVGATLTLLFAVLTAAELTDDLKPPGSAAHLASAETTGIPAKTAPDARGVAPATNMAAMGVQPVEPAVQAAPAAEPSTVIGDLDTPDVPAAAPAKKAGKKPKAAKKLALRNAPF